MKLLFFCPRWGQEQTQWDEFLSKVKDAGFDGVEASLPLDITQQEEILNGLSKYGLQLIGQHYETTVKDFEQHCDEYKGRLNNLAAAKPIFINTQTGKDYYSFEQNAALIKIAAEIEQESHVTVLHETHRGKFSFAAHIMKHFLEQLPNLKITLDISHWCATAESYLHDQADTISLAFERTEHIHARIGYPEGPQITDPRAPEWKEAVDFHLSCWDKIVERQKRQNKPYVSFTPEFGAPPYLPLLPYTKQPIVSQWEVNCYMMDLLRNRYHHG